MTLDQAALLSIGGNNVEGRRIARAAEFLNVAEKLIGRLPPPEQDQS